ncbi:MAG TPA: succinate dehydrogenase, hydrophobic membrane anchor protein [Rudaea sp.]|jgi:succinate dehydrogenase / fumarate reductase membrane anchor subunit|uniref:succinate dehydrogenase, hydrophobic membrane anchor protein n=1 Tax=Rudaea sp. TaxID=2136325 RepID=UPI002F94F385
MSDENVRNQSGPVATTNARAVDYQTPLKRVLALGSARGGTHHFITQRVTALALIPLTLWALALALALVRADYAHARAILHHTFAAVWLSAFVVAVFWHAQLGLQVVIEDYVHTRWLEVVSQLAVKFFCVIGALTAVVAIGRIAFA